MNNDIELITDDWGTVPYAEAWDRQRQLFDAALAARQAALPHPDHLILVEHPPVYTLGRSGKAMNMLLSDAQLKAIGATLYHIDRGGDITFHGPGQLVAYPILNLEHYDLGLKAYIHLLEEAVIRTCAAYGVRGDRVEGATGVWLDVGTPRERKICAIGVRSSHFVTMHGLALNVNTDLNFFRYIHPCGFIDKGVTSLAVEVGRPVEMAEVKERLDAEIRGLLNIR
jgi:lipoyl(octanoyl) transferase